MITINTEDIATVFQSVNSLFFIFPSCPHHRSFLRSCFNPLIVASSLSLKEKDLDKNTRPCFNPLIVASSLSRAPHPLVRGRRHSFNPLIVASSLSHQIY